MQGRPAQILLVGRPELWDRLGANELAPLNDRLILRLDLKPFDERTSKAYIDSLLVKPRRIVGQAFTSDAEREIINRAQGKADRIKALVNATLLQADAQAYPPITINQVLAATNGAQKAESQEADHKETAQTFSSDFLPGAHKTATSRGRPANKAARSLERLPVSWRSKRVLAATGAAVVVASAGILWLQPKKPQTVPPAPPAHSTAFPAAGLPEAGAARDRASVDRPHQEAARGTASLTASLRAGRAPDASPPVVPPAASTPMPATAATDRPPSPHAWRRLQARARCRPCAGNGASSHGPHEAFRPARLYGFHVRNLARHGKQHGLDAHRDTGSRAASFAAWRRGPCQTGPCPPPRSAATPRASRPDDRTLAAPADARAAPQDA